MRTIRASRDLRGRSRRRLGQRRPHLGVVRDPLVLGQRQPRGRRVPEHPEEQHVEHVGRLPRDDPDLGDEEAGDRELDVAEVAARHAVVGERPVGQGGDAGQRDEHQPEPQPAQEVVEQLGVRVGHADEAEHRARQPDPDALDLDRPDDVAGVADRRRHHDRAAQGDRQHLLLPLDHAEAQRYQAFCTGRL